ncbi:hypothetical protein D3C87_1673590 [compost metagenome]
MAGAWQNRFTLKGLLVSAAVSRNMARACSTLLAPIPMDPSPPAFDTAAASLGVETPTIGD